MDKVEIYWEILESIEKRTGGNWDDMTYVDKVVTAMIAKDIISDVDKFLAEQYNTLKKWAELSIEDIRLSETEPCVNFNNDRLNILENIKL